jgi:hypothetical protein
MNIKGKISYDTEQMDEEKSRRGMMKKLFSFQIYYMTNKRSSISGNMREGNA